jgi:hypothetical protein
MKAEPENASAAGTKSKTGRQQLLPSRDLSNQAAITRQAELYEF